MNNQTFQRFVMAKLKSIGNKFQVILINSEI